MDTPCKPLNDIDEAVPFQLPSSYGLKAVCTAVLLAVAAVASACAVAVAPWGGVLDAGASIVAAYIVGLFCFQTCMMEWPHVDDTMAMLLVAAFGAFFFPTLARSNGCWGWGTWFVSSCADAALAMAAWRHMVRGPICKLPCLRGRVCIITGSNSGIGYEAAEALALAGATIIFACRNKAKAQAAMAQIVQRSGRAKEVEDQLRFIALDVSSMKSVRQFVEEFAATNLPLHMLILNAGVMLQARALSEDGLEMTLASNHFGHFLLSRLLLPRLRETEAQGEQPRVVVVGSNMCYRDDVFDFSEAVQVTGEKEKQAFFEKPYTLFRAYAQSKLANLLFTVEFDRRLRQDGSQISINALHPGEVMTEVMRDMPALLLGVYGIARRHMRPILELFLKTPQQGSSCMLHVATASDAVSGAFFIRHRPAQMSRIATDPAIAEKLWSLSEQVTNAPAM